MELEFEKYSNGNLKVTLVTSGVNKIEISRCIEKLPEGVAYIDKEYLDVVKNICGRKCRKIATTNKFRTALKFAIAA